MKYITEYIPIVNGRVKLNFVPTFIEETLSYALLNDSFELFNEDYEQSIPYNGNIVKIDNSFYLVFTLDEELESFFNVSVTYGVDDGLGSALDELKELLGVDSDTIGNYDALITDFKEQNFLDADVEEPIFLPTYICEKVDYVATQYKHSERLKALISTHLCKLEEPFSTMNNIKDVLDLESVNGLNLEFIGKIVGVNRKYCNLEHSPALSVFNVQLEDECLRKLIRLKIVKNNKKTINYKELEELLKHTFNSEVAIKNISDFEIEIYFKNVLEISTQCLILITSMLPVPPTIKIRYYFELDVVAEVKVNTVTDALMLHFYSDINETVSAEQIALRSAWVFAPVIKADINEVFLLQDTKLRGGYAWQLEV